MFREIAAQREQLLLWVPVFIALGVGWYFSLRSEPPVTLTVLVAGALITALSLFYPARYKHIALTTLWFCALAVFLVVLGFGAAQLRTVSIKTVMLSDEASPVEVVGTVSAIERLDEDNSGRLILKNLRIEDVNRGETPEKIRIKVHDTGEVRVGDKISVLAGLNPPSPPVVPYGFDFQRYAYFKQIGAFGFAYQKPVVIQEKTESTISLFLEELRHGIGQTIEQTLHGQQLAIVTALMTGQRSLIRETDWEALRNAGLAHMLAISGLHVGLIAAVVFFIARFLMVLSTGFSLRHPVKKYAAVFALLAAFAYVLLVGSTIPAQRALMMTGIVLIGVMLDRVAISLRLLALAASALLLFRPESLMSASFQMSFSAVACLIVFYEHIRKFWSAFYAGAGWWRRLMLYMGGVSITTIIASLATGLFSLYHFQQFAFLGIISNLLAVPVLAFIVMPAAVISFFLMPFGAGFIPLKIMGMGVSAILAIAHDVSVIPYAALFPPAMPLSALVMTVIGTLFLILWKGYGRMLSICFFVLAAVFLFQHKQPDIYISSGSKLVAIRDKAGLLHVNNRVHDRFALSTWLRFNGQNEDDKPLWEKMEGMRCGEWGCHIVKKGRKIAFSEHAGGSREDCGWANILISAEPVKQCRSDIVIDRFDGWKYGAHAIWLDSNKVISVSDVRGMRPWTVRNSR